jgi:S1-C subfamily serine protease
MKVINSHAMSAPRSQGTASQGQEQQAAPRSWWGHGGEKETRKRSAKETFYDTQKVLVLVEKVMPGSPAFRSGIKRYSKQCFIKCMSKVCLMLVPL